MHFHVFDGYIKPQIPYIGAKTPATIKHNFRRAIVVGLNRTSTELNSAILTVATKENCGTKVGGLGDTYCLVHLDRGPQVVVTTIDDLAGVGIGFGLHRLSGLLADKFGDDGFIFGGYEDIVKFQVYVN
jgi:hypothetical protein